MVPKSFRVPATVWEAFEARAAAEGANPTEVVRELVTAWAEEKK